MPTDACRRSFLAYFAGLGLTSTLFPGVLCSKAEQHADQPVTLEMLREAAVVAGVQFSDQQLQAMLNGVNENLKSTRELRKTQLTNGVAPPLYFNPWVPGVPVDRTRKPFRASTPRASARPGNLEEVAFWPVTQLAQLVREKKISSVELTEMYLGRLKRLNPKLLCAVTITEELALKQAHAADQEISAGKYRGPLHGIPYGVKDLCSVKGYPTTWGAAPFRDRVIDEDATVVSRLKDAGAVLIAKLATGELALDDQWFGGQTKNPWDLSMGSQGSSAGPASATAAGLVGFSIGTETGGSIVEPSGICGVTGLRPTFGRVSRHGAMALSWSLDKIGPMCRSVEDCALVLAAIQGRDERDLTTVDVPFNWDATFDIHKLRVGYLKAAFDDTRQTAQTNANDAAALAKIRSMGVNLVEVALPEHANLDITPIIYAEGNAALRDPVELRPAGLVRQDRVTHQNTFLFYTAAQYLDANRVRMLLMQEMARMMADIDVYLVPFDYSDYTPNPVGSLNTSANNLTGHPCVVVPHGFNEKGDPTSLTFVGQLYGEAKMLALAKAYQDATEWHLQHPKMVLSPAALDGDQREYTIVPAYRGRFPCFFGGFLSRFVSSISRARISFARVSRG
jgi:Asp-tRNA(Asn)/Glu-tRNA(Gln) amidotransferase A subunit family amidase